MATDKERLSKTKRLLIETLEDLGDEELKNFQWFLQQDDILEGFPAIKKSKVEKANRQDTVDQMVQTYHHHSLEVTKKVLMKINRNDLEQSLSNSSSGPKGPLEVIGASVAEAAAGVGDEVAQLFPTHRQCAILITNGCSHHTLCNPRFSYCFCDQDVHQQRALLCSSVTNCLPFHI
ncbi:uncharacterized protein [Centroberyx affinis]|uniref:uncharacterized protein isoform X2 n=1 Tax=Centroberyx affinis TaxID=166261 RepID=UPI003A5BC4A7